MAVRLISILSLYMLKKILQKFVINNTTIRSIELNCHNDMSVATFFIFALKPFYTICNRVGIGQNLE